MHIYEKPRRYRITDDEHRRRIYTREVYPRLLQKKKKKQNLKKKFSIFKFYVI